MWRDVIIITLTHLSAICTYEPRCGGYDFLYNLIKNSDFVFYMGGQDIGKKIESFCCSHNIEFLGEYGGDDWAIILDGNIHKIAAQISKNVLFKEGKDCDSIKGILVIKSRYDEIKKILFKELKSLVKENPTDDEIINPPFQSSIWIKKFNILSDVLKVMEKNKHGLSVSIYDTNKKRALEFAKKINTARVIINSDTLDIHPLIPWGGTKETSRGGVDYWSNKFVNKKIIEIN